MIPPLRRGPHETRAASGRADRPRPGGLVHLRRLEAHGLSRATPSASAAVRGREARVLALFKYHRPRGLLCCSGHCPNCQDDGRRRAERPRLYGADPRGRRRRGAERALVARLRLHVPHRQDRRAVHARRLLLPEVHPPARGLAAVREVPAQRGRTRKARSRRRALAPLRHRAPPGARPRGRRRRGRSRRRARGREGGLGRRPGRRGRTPRGPRTRRCRGARAGARARDLGGRARPGRRRHGSLPLPRREDRRRHGCDGAAGRLPWERPRSA